MGKYCNPCSWPVVSEINEIETGARTSTLTTHHQIIKTRKSGPWRSWGKVTESNTVIFSRATQIHICVTGHDNYGNLLQVPESVLGLTQIGRHDLVVLSGDEHPAAYPVGPLHAFHIDSNWVLYLSSLPRPIKVNKVDLHVIRVI